MHRRTRQHERFISGELSDPILVPGMAHHSEPTEMILHPDVREVVSRQCCNDGVHSFLEPREEWAVGVVDRDLTRPHQYRR